MGAVYHKYDSCAIIAAVLKAKESMRQKRARYIQSMEIVPAGSAIPYSIVVEREAGQWTAKCPELLLKTIGPTKEDAVGDCLSLMEKRINEDAQKLLSHVKGLADLAQRRDIVTIIYVHE